MGKIKPLICFANAYDCIESIEALKTIPCDQLHVEYFPYPQNYIEIEKWLESHKEYTHILYIAPDIVLTKSAYLIMIDYIKQHDPPVYGPSCNVDQNNDALACCLKLPEIFYWNRRYRWVKEHHRQYFLEHDMPLIQVKFNANLAFVRRDIFDKIPYMALPYDTDERPIHESAGGYACDLAFCHYCNHLDIPILVDMRVKLKHLRYAGPLQVGKKEPKITFYNYND